MEHMKLSTRSLVIVLGLFFIPNETPAQSTPTGERPNTSRTAPAAMVSVGKATARCRKAFVRKRQT